jgi:hypothetical protein
VTFTNNGATPCYLSGYPGAAVNEGLHRRRVGNTDLEVASAVGVRLITLKPRGGVASLILYIQRANSRSTSQCGPTDIDAVTLTFNPRATFYVPVGHHEVCSMYSFAATAGAIVNGHYGLSTKGNP